MILSKPNHIKIYGHRGARGDLPENTLESFKYLFDNAINAYETDILISKDLIPVITHDFRLDPSLTKDKEGNWIKDENIKIFDLTYDEISKFDVGSLNKLTRYGRRFVNQRSLENQKIPKLSELLELSSKNVLQNLLINLEIKSTPDEKNLTPNPKDLTQIVLNEINNSNLKDKIIISSFDWRILREVKKQSPEIPRAYLTFQQEEGMKIKKTIYSKSPWIDHIPLTIVYDLPKIIKELGGSAWHPYYKDINKKAVKDAHDNNLPVNVWTVNDEDDMLKMIEYGVDGIMTDYPLRLKNLCEKRSINWF
ncbi:glycerophosphodiester phosphodiesterase [Candidatus Pelagibacter bacterium]|nr:glycerophosphodiester phosphodiesterase [Candidatus Pelagibacter sp.]MDB2545266.1 glycerophosphodiester phosphodiesterase [Candidatus Pelagibacter bacterium]